MVQKWHLCIEVSCFPNPSRAVIKFVLYNMGTNHLFHGKREVPGMTTNNEAYYIALVERLKEAKQHDVNDIEVFTNSELICNQMKGIYPVRKDNLQPLHNESNKLEFSISTFYHQSLCIYWKDVHWYNVQSIFKHICRCQIWHSITIHCNRNHWSHQYRSPLCEWVVVIIFLGSIIAWFFH